MYDMNITTKVSVSTKEVACRLAEDMSISVSEFSRIAIEEHVRNMLKAILIERGFDDVNALSLMDCMSSDGNDGIVVDDVVLAYRSVGGRVRDATRDEVEDALASVDIVVTDKESRDVKMFQNGKEIIDGENDMLMVARFDRELGVMVIA